MKNSIFVQCLSLFFWLSLITGLLYPVLVTTIAHFTMRHSSHGSLIESQGKVIGSELIAQDFKSPKYFWPRPSAVDYNPLPSGGSNFGPTSKKLHDAVQDRLERLVQAHNIQDQSPVPFDMLFTSGSGLDPHININSALFQMERIASARNLKIDQIKSLIDQSSERTHFVEPYVNVLKLNRMLDQLDKNQLQK